MGVVSGEGEGVAEVMEGYRKASRPHFPECDGCKLMHGCLYGQGRTKCQDPECCPRNPLKCAATWDCWYLSASAPCKLKLLLCPVYKQYHAAAVRDDADAYRQAIIAATSRMLTEHMLPTAERMHRTDLAAIILDELERRGEYNKPKEAMRL